MGTTTNAKILKNESDNDATKIPYINAGMDDLDSLVCGMITIDVSGTGNMTAFTRAQSIFRVMKFNGTLTGNRVVFMDPTVGCARVFMVWNATTGGFDLTVKTTAVGSAGIAVTQGAKADLMHDGTDVLYAGPEV